MAFLCDLDLEPSSILVVCSDVHVVCGVVLVIMISVNLRHVVVDTVMLVWSKKILYVYLFSHN